MADDGLITLTTPAPGFEQADDYGPLAATYGHVPDASGLVTLDKPAPGFEPEPPADTSGLGGILDYVPNLALQGMASSVDGVGSLGALMDSLGVDFGNELRQESQSWSDILRQKLSPEYQAALNRSYLTFGPENALLSPRSWAANIVGQIPNVAAILTGGAAGGIIGGPVGAVVGAGTVAGTLGYAQSAQSFGQVADQYGLTDEERRTGEVLAGVPSAATSAVAGIVTGGLAGVIPSKIIGAGLTATIGRRFAVGAAEEALDNASQQAAVEAAKGEAGIPVDPAAVVEAAVQGGAVGFALGGGVGALGERAKARSQQAAKDALAQQDAARAASIAQLQQSIDDGSAQLAALQAKVVSPGTLSGDRAKFISQYNTLRAQLDGHRAEMSGYTATVPVPGATDATGNTTGLPEGGGGAAQAVSPDGLAGGSAGQPDQQPGLAGPAGGVPGPGQAGPGGAVEGAEGGVVRGQGPGVEVAPSVSAGAPTPITAPPLSQAPPPGQRVQFMIATENPAIMRAFYTDGSTGLVPKPGAVLPGVALPGVAPAAPPATPPSITTETVPPAAAPAAPAAATVATPGLTPTHLDTYRNNAPAEITVDANNIITVRSGPGGASVATLRRLEPGRYTPLPPAATGAPLAGAAPTPAPPPDPASLPKPEDAPPETPMGELVKQAYNLEAAYDQSYEARQVQLGDYRRGFKAPEAAPAAKTRGPIVLPDASGVPLPETEQQRRGYQRYLDAQDALRLAEGRLNDLQDIAGQPPKSKAAKAKAVAAFREATAAFRAAQAELQAASAADTAVGQLGFDLRDPAQGMPIEPTPAVAEPDYRQLANEIDQALGPSDEPLPLDIELRAQESIAAINQPQLEQRSIDAVNRQGLDEPGQGSIDRINAGVRRSQAARRAAITRATRRQASTAPPAAELSEGQALQADVRGDLAAGKQPDRPQTEAPAAAPTNVGPADVSATPKFVQQTGRTEPAPPEPAPSRLGELSGNAEKQAVQAKLAKSFKKEPRTGAGAPGGNPPAGAASAPGGAPSPPATPVPGASTPGPAAGPIETPFQSDQGEQPPAPVSPRAVYAPTPANPPGTAATIAAAETPRRSSSLVKLITDELRKGPQRVDDLLQKLQIQSRRGAKTAQGDLIKLLRGAFPGTKDEPSPVIVQAGSLENGYQALYDPANDRVTVDLDQAEDIATATLHEIVHAATIGRIRTNRVFAGQIEALMNQARSLWDEKGNLPTSGERQGFQNTEEFIATALTDSEFADQLDGLLMPHAQKSVWQRISDRIARAFGFMPATEAEPLFYKLMKFIPDQAFFEDNQSRAAFQAEMARLGLTETAPLMSALRSLLRDTGAKAGLRYRGEGEGKRLQTGWLRFETSHQIANSFGWIGRSFRMMGVVDPVILEHNTVNEYARLLDAKDGFVAGLRLQYEQVAEVLKQTHSKYGAKEFDDVIIDARLSKLYPYLAKDHPLNAQGTLVGKGAGELIYDDLRARWDKLAPQQQEAMRLEWAAAEADQHSWVNTSYLATVRAMGGDEAADKLETFVNSRPVKTQTFAGVTISYQPVLTIGELKAQMPLLVAPAKQKDVLDRLRQVSTMFPAAVGPYVPLRRNGDYLAIIRSKVVEAELTGDELRKLYLDNFRLHGSDINVIDAPTVTADGRKYKIKYDHLSVSAHDSELEANQARDENKADFIKRGLGIENALQTQKRSVQYEAIGLNRGTVQALQEAIKNSLNLEGADGDLASEQIMKYYLEKLPDTSIKKHRIRAKGVAGASRDTLHSFVNYAHFNATYQGQMRYGPRISRVLTSYANQDIKRLQVAGKFGQANDLATLIDTFKQRETTAVFDANRNAHGRQWAEKMAAKVPQVTGAMLLAGYATTILNTFQPIQVTLPYLGAKYGMYKSGKVLAGVYRDLGLQPFKETGKEIGRAIGRTPAAAKAIFKNQPTPTFKDTSAPTFQLFMKGMDPLEQEHIDELARTKKIDYGMIADLNSLIDRQGKFGKAFSYSTAAAFIPMQMAETYNRILTGLASRRLFLAANPTLDAKDPAVKAQLVDQAGRDIDLTQGNYSASSKPVWLRGAIGRSVGTFKTYPQTILYLVGRNIIQAINPDQPGNRKEALKFLGGFAAMTYAAGGLMGIVNFEPITYALTALAFMASGGDDPDPEALLRRLLEAFGLDVGESDLVLKGPGYAAGYTPDLSSRLGVPQILPTTDILRTSFNPKAGTSDYLAAIGNVALGAPYQFTGQVMAGVAAMAQGDVLRGLQNVTPTGFGLRDAIEAYRYATEGVTTAAGQVLVPPENVGWRDLVTRYLGFDPPEIGRQKAATRAFSRQDAILGNRRNRVLSTYSEATLGGDAAGARDALQEIIKFNKAHPERAVTRNNLLASVKARVKSAAAYRQFGAPAITPAQRLLARRTQRLYGASTL